MKRKWIMAVGMVLLCVLTVNEAFAADGITILIHGSKISSDVPAKIENGRTLVPLKVIAEGLNQIVKWDPETRTVTVDEQKEKPSSIERIVAQRNKDMIVSDDPEHAVIGKNANLAFIYNLKTLYNEVYRGFLNPDPDAANGKIITDKDLGFISDSLTVKDGQEADEGCNYVRLVQPPYVRQAGQNEPSRKDVIFYMDATDSDDLFMAVQNPEKLTEWKVYQATGYGDWFLKELDIYYRGARGIGAANDSTQTNLTNSELKGILGYLIPKAASIYGMFNGEGWFDVDKWNTIPGEEDYHLVTGERWDTAIDTSNVKSVADIKKVVEDVFTNEMAQKLFYSKYLTPQEGARPLYKDYNGQLYVDTRNGGHGSASEYFVDTAEIISQEGDVVVARFNTTEYDSPYKMTVKIQKVNGKWLMASGSSFNNEVSIKYDDVLKYKGEGSLWSAALEETVWDFGNGKNKVYSRMTLTYTGPDVDQVGKVNFTYGNAAKRYKGTRIASDGIIGFDEYDDNRVLPAKDDVVNVTVEWDGKQDSFDISQSN